MLCNNVKAEDVSLKRAYFRGYHGIKLYKSNTYRLTQLASNERRKNI